MSADIYSRLSSLEQQVRFLTQQLGGLSGGGGGAPGPAPNGLPTGGTDGQVLTKLGTADYAAVWATPTGGGGGVTDHGALSGLGDDDHTQYHTDARGDARYRQLSVAVPWADLSGVPLSFTPSAHSHTIGDVAGLATALNDLAVGLAGKRDAGAVPWADLSGVPSTFTPSAHTHAAGDITSGVFAVARLGTGTADSTRFLRGDGTWATPPAGGLVLGASAVGILKLTGAGNQRWFSMPTGGTLAALANVANRIIIAPVTIAHSTTVSQLGMNVSTAGATNLGRVVVFESDADGRPSTLLTVSNEMTLGTTGRRLANLPTNFTFEAGKTYWVGIWTFDGTGQVNIPPASARVVLAVGSISGITFHYSLTKTVTYSSTGSPGDWGTYADTQLNVEGAPLIIGAIV